MLFLLVLVLVLVLLLVLVSVLHHALLKKKKECYHINGNIVNFHLARIITILLRCVVFKSEQFCSILYFIYSKDWLSLKIYLYNTFYLNKN